MEMPAGGHMTHLPQRQPLVLIHRAKAKAEVVERMGEEEHHLKTKVQEAKIERKVQTKAAVLIKTANLLKGEKTHVRTSPLVKRRIQESVAGNAVLGGTNCSQVFSESKPMAYGPIQMLIDSLLNNSTMTCLTSQPQVEKVSLRTLDPLTAATTRVCRRSRNPLMRKFADSVAQ